jgi:hypothetical protein
MVVITTVLPKDILGRIIAMGIPEDKQPVAAAATSRQAAGRHANSATGLEYAGSSTRENTQ